MSAPVERAIEARDVGDEDESGPWSREELATVSLRGSGRILCVRPSVSAVVFSTASENGLTEREARNGRWAAKAGAARAAEAPARAALRVGPWLGMGSPMKCERWYHYLAERACPGARPG